MLICIPVFKGFLVFYGMLVFYGIPVSGIKKYLDINTGANKIPSYQFNTGILPSYIASHY